MVRFLTLLLTIFIFTGAFQVASAEENIRTCALTKAFECTSEDGCREWSIQEMALPRFIRIDLKTKTIKSLDKDIARNSSFKDLDRLEGMIVLHGTEQRGWSMALGENSRDLTLSASGDGEGFVVFGSCMNP